MINDETLMQLLVEANTNTNNDARCRAEQALMQLTLAQHMQSLLDVVRANTPASEYAAIFLRTLLKKKQLNEQEYDSQFQLHDMTAIIKTLQESLPMRIKQHLLQAVTVLLGEDDILRNYVQQAMIDSFARQDAELGILLWGSLVDSLDMYRLGTMMQNSDYQWVQCYVTRGIKILLGVADLLRTTHTVSLLTNQLLLGTLTLMRQWTQGIASLLTKITKFKGFPKENLIGFQNFLLHNNEFSFGMYSYLGVTINVGQQITDALISCTGEAALDDLLNEGKLNVLCAYNLILDIIFNERQKADCRKTPFFAMLTQLLPGVVVSTVCYAQSQAHDFLAQMRAPHIAPLFSQMMRMMVLSGSQPEFYALLSEAKVPLLVDIVLPLLCTTSEEFVQMIDEPQEFVNLALDTVDKQSSDIPKTAAAALLEMLCDHIDGTTTFMAQLCVMCITDQVQQLAYVEALLGNTTQRYFFSRVSSLFRIDACLVALTIMSYLLSRRADILTLIETMLQVNSDFFRRDSLDGLVRARLALFFGYYCDNVFKVESQRGHLMDYINILIKQLFPCPHNWHRAVKYQSVDALKNIFEDEELTPILRPLIPSVFLIFAQSVMDTTYEPHFELMTSLFKIYAKEIQAYPHLFTQALQLLLQNAMKEYHLYLQDKKDHQLFVEKSIHILRSIPESNCYSPDFLAMLESQLLPLYDLMEQAWTPFEEEIIHLICALMEGTGSVSLNQQKMFLLMPQIMQRQKIKLDVMFQALHLYIQKGTDMFRSLEAQQMLCHIAFSVISHNAVDASEAEQGEGVLLLHMVLQTLTIEEQVLVQIFQGAYAKAQSEIRSNFLKSRLMGVFMCALYFDQERSMRVLFTLGMLDTLLPQMTKIIYPGGYDTKLYVITMAKLLETKPMLFTAGIIKNLVTLLQRQQQHEEREQMRADLDSSDEDILIDEDDDDDEEEQEAKTAFEHFKSDIMSIDEFQRFNAVIMLYKQSQPELIQQLKSQLTPIEMQQLQNMIACVRVESVDGIMIPRKIVQIQQKKRKLIN